MIRLYYSPGACSLAPHILLEELSIGYELQRVSIDQGETAAPEFLALNPKGRVPVLAENGSILTETPAILVYLSLRDPQQALLPAAPLEHARCLEWFNWLSATVHAVGYGELWRPARFTAKRDHYPQICAKGKENIIDAYRQIETRIEGRIWAVGNRYSCIDPYLLVFYLWGRTIGLDMAADHPSWSAHAARMLERGAVQRALRQEGLGA